MPRSTSLPSFSPFNSPCGPWFLTLYPILRRLQLRNHPRCGHQHRLVPPAHPAQHRSALRLRLPARYQRKGALRPQSLRARRAERILFHRRVEPRHLQHRRARLTDLLQSGSHVHGRHLRHALIDEEFSGHNSSFLIANGFCRRRRRPVRRCAFLRARYFSRDSCARPRPARCSPARGRRAWR